MRRSSRPSSAETKPESVHVRVSPDAKRKIEEFVASLATHLGRDLNLSDYIRGALIGMEIDIWRKSPYVCNGATHLVVVTRDGTFFYWRREELLFNGDIGALPATLRMKREKREHFYRERQGDPESLRGFWRLNQFSLWTSDPSNPRWIVSQTDRTGKTAKIVIFKQNFQQGSTYIRDTAVVLDNYAEYESPPTTSSTSPTAAAESTDRADISVTVPTRNLEILVMVDRDLFRQTDRYFGRDYKPKLRLELRNAEESPLPRSELDDFFPKDFFYRISSWYPKASNWSRDDDPNYASSLERARELVDGLRARLLDIAANELLEEERRTVHFNDLLLPKEFLFYHARCPWTHPAMVYSICWPKPWRPSVDESRRD